MDQGQVSGRNWIREISRDRVYTLHIIATIPSHLSVMDRLASLDPLGFRDAP